MPVIVSGGMDGADHIRWVFEHTGCAAVMLARGALGNPWLFEQVLGARDGEPDARGDPRRVGWVVDRAVEHLGAERAARYLRKFHPGTSSGSAARRPDAGRAAARRRRSTSSGP